VHIQQGGSTLIDVRDNGSGIHPDDLMLAVLRHATSKITTPEQLAAIATLGFRGEALASIAAISRFSLSSSQTSDGLGYEITVEAAAPQENVESPNPALALKPVAHSRGSRVVVRDLFFNVPARRKFLKSVGTEFSHIDEVIKRMALAHFDVAFVLVHQDQIKLDLPVADSGELRLQRVRKVLGGRFADTSFWMDAQSLDLRIAGWLGHPTEARAQADLKIAVSATHCVWPMNRCCTAIATLHFCCFLRLILNGWMSTYIPPSMRCALSPNVKCTNSSVIMPSKFWHNFKLHPQNWQMHSIPINDRCPSKYNRY
jgi:DNA mismatch repair protein MutL